MTYLNVYPDLFQKIGEFLESDDLFSMSLTCKAAYKAFHRPDIQKRISWPLLKPKRLTADQREVIKAMEKLQIQVKLVCGSVGAGKSIVALAYSLRNGFDKIILVVPPNLISMWTKTCIDFFSLAPLVLHNSNSKYNPRKEYHRETPPEEKIILMSYIIFSRGQYEWMKGRFNDVCIVDEAHHSLYFGDRNYKEVIALSATAFKKDELTYGIRRLCQQYDIAVEAITFNLDKTVISNKLPPIFHLPPHVWKIKEELSTHIIVKKRVPMKGVNDLRDLKWIPEMLSHPFIKDIDKLYLGGFLTVGKKKLNIPLGDRTAYFQIREEFYKTRKYSRESTKEFIMFQEELSIKTIEPMISSNIKYRQCLSICEYVRKRGEKAIIFDINVTYLPFLHKFLHDRGINSYLFTTHYDVGGRQRQLEKFKVDTDAVVLLSSIAMLGEGHNVTEANHVIFLSTFPEANKYYQAIGRCHRYPQSKNVYVHYLFNSQMDLKIYEHSQGLIDLSEVNWDPLLQS